MKKYEAYKNSSIEWIGEIPEGWEIVPLKHYLSLKGRIGWNGLKSEEFQKQSYAYLVTGQDFNSDVVNWDKCYQINKERYDEDPFIQLENGDLLVTKDGTIGKVAKVVNLDKPACLNSGIFVVKQTKGVFEQNYLYWILASNQLKEFVGFNSTGSTIAHLYQNVFENMPLTVPPLSEQQAIASYLDHKVGQIDASVSAINAQIDDLKAYRQSIISEAVTKGLNPDTKMKDSGIEWIGEIPEGWETSKLKFESKMVLGKMLEDKEPKDNKGEYTQEYYLKSRNIGMLEVFTDKDKLDKMWFSNKEKELYLLQKGDLVMNEGGDIGKVALWKPTDFACYIQNSVHKLTPKENLYASFLQYLISYISSTGYFMTVVSAISIAHLTKEKLAETPLLIPPLSEQRAIADYLDKKTSEIDSAISSLEAQRDDLNALKQSIISEAVTGKIDLRDWNSDK